MGDLVEYPQGGEFPGAIGRTVQESSPRGRRRCGRRTVRRT